MMVSEELLRKVRELEACLGRLAVAARFNATGSVETRCRNLKTDIVKLMTVLQVLGDRELTPRELVEDVPSSRESIAEFFCYGPEELLPELTLLLGAEILCAWDRIFHLKAKCAHYVQVLSGVYVALRPRQSILPRFRVRIEGDQLLAVREELVTAIPEAMELFGRVGIAALQDGKGVSEDVHNAGAEAVGQDGHPQDTGA